MLGLPSSFLAIAAVVGEVVAFRFQINWNRKYHELWLDREKWIKQALPGITLAGAILSAQMHRIF